MLPQVVNPTSQQNIYKRNEKSEQEPDLNHLDLGQPPQI